MAETTGDHSLIIVVGLAGAAASLTMACYRWKDIGHYPAWGLLTIIPFVQLYGFFMPSGGRENGMDTAGKVWLVSVGLILVAALIIANT
jgi:uncharacterized membrane protein YhaH (DUF805 family)